MGDAEIGPIRLSFNPQLRVEFRGATVTSDAGLLLPRELDKRLGLDALIDQHLTDPRTGHNRQFLLPDLFRQSIYSRLAGYADTNDAQRLAEDPTFRMLASRERRETSVALISTLHWFETDALTDERNYQGLARLNTALIQHAAARSENQRVTLDIDSSESPVHGTQEQSAYNGHFESVCYHPLFVFNPEGDCLAAKLRPGNVHSAEGWDEVLLPIIDQDRRRGKTVVVRADAAFAQPALYESLERRRVRYAIRLPANDVLERQIEDLLTRPRGRPSHAPLVRYRSFHYQAASWDRPRRVIAKVEHHLGELFPRVPSVSRQRGEVAPGRHRLQPRQPAAPAGVAGRDPELVADESPTAVAQNRRAADPARPVLHAAARRKLLDRSALSADSPAHRAAGVAPDVIRREQPRVARRATAGVSLGNDGLRRRASTETGLATLIPQERAVSPERKPRNGGRQAVAPSPRAWSGDADGTISQIPAYTLSRSAPSRFLCSMVGALILLALAAAPVPAAPFAYITNFTSNTVSVLDTATNTVVATLPVGTHPTGVAVHPSGTSVYVANFVSNTVSVLDTATNTVVATLPVGTQPSGLAVHPLGTSVYVANFRSNTVSVLDTATKTVVATIPVDAPVNVAVHPAGTFVYAVDDGPNVLSVIATATNTVTATVRFAVAFDASPGVAVHPAGTFVYVPNTYYDAVSVIATATNTVVATVPVGTRPMSVAVHPSGRFVYVTNTFTLGRSSNDVSVIDTATNTVVATIPMEGVPAGVAVHPVGTFVYVTNIGTSDVAVIDTTTNTLVATVPMGMNSDGVAIGPQLPGLSLTLNQANFLPGNRLALWATTYPEDRSRLVDAYVQVQPPSGASLFVQADGSFTTDRRPLVSNWPVRPFSGEIVRYTFRGGEPSGSYRLLGYFTEPGTSEIVGLPSQAAFTFSP